jgi:hypothetical protein
MVLIVQRPFATIEKQNRSFKTPQMMVVLKPRHEPTQFARRFFSASIKLHHTSRTQNACAHLTAFILDKPDPLL